MKELSKTVKALAIEACAKIAAGIATIQEGCKMYVEALDSDPSGVRALMKERGIPEAVLDLYESVGRGRMSQRLLFLPCPANERLQRAPLEEQERLLNVGVEVIHFVGDEPKMTVKPVSKLTKSESELAVDSGGQVSREIQIERLRRRILTHTFKMPPYSLEGDMLYARENCRIPFSELERLYREAHKANSAKTRTLEADIKRRQVVKD